MSKTSVHHQCIASLERSANLIPTGLETGIKYFNTCHWSSKTSHLLPVGISQICTLSLSKGQTCISSKIQQHQLTVVGVFSSLPMEIYTWRAEELTRLSSKCSIHCFWPSAGERKTNEGSFTRRLILNSKPFSWSYPDIPFISIASHWWTNLTQSYLPQTAFNDRHESEQTTIRETK